MSATPAMMADGFTRASGKDVHDGGPERPGHHQLRDPVKTAYWNHTPLLLVTPRPPT
jgi:sulfoacetaldehyde acetyltransferase